MKIPTLLTHLGEDDRVDPYGAVIPPLYQNSLFTFADWDDADAAFSHPQERCIYSRGNNPTVNLVEAKIAALCGAEKAKLFGSGMAAITSAMLHCVKTGDHIITVNNIYGPANNFLNHYLQKKFQIETTFVDGRDVNDFTAAIRPNTSLIYLESPSSAKFTLQDIKGISQLAKQHGIKTIIDNTWATPIFQKPLKLGVDLEVHSCSKYFGGHSDLVSGVIAGCKDDIDQIALNEYALLGGKASPFEAWLILRSLRTMDIRMEKHMRSALTVATFLDHHPTVEKVHYPGLSSFLQYGLAKTQMTGYSGLMAFDLKTDDLQKIKDFIHMLKLFKLGVSWGGHESLVFVPAISYMKEMPVERFAEMGISLSTVRISVGLEDANDLIDDLSQALNKIDFSGGK